MQLPLLDSELKEGALCLSERVCGRFFRFEPIPEWTGGAVFAERFTLRQTSPKDKDK